jgi:hypothetical protein
MKQYYLLSNGSASFYSNGLYGLICLKLNAAYGMYKKNPPVCYPADFYNVSHFNS